VKFENEGLLLWVLLTTMYSQGLKFCHTRGLPASDIFGVEYTK